MTCVCVCVFVLNSRKAAAAADLTGTEPTHTHTSAKKSVRKSPRVTQCSGLRSICGKGSGKNAAVTLTQCALMYILLFLNIKIVIF